ncbi:MAG: hypothetical protein COU11_03870 [Candidatus Harrisonbacteria bacterium CG10_big_fil_rev_8_21_14_0_10_49_15]|uniref:Uncharacterized protein n=1 Tax=Candidatus Harrisonbacteria bacterium CG10_big_fil_rev_8_21_14_0_10_49_15 TaxID=1974587 RepID=A0A2H0UK83_9BACT|nr:MAG: hypothetical protein COU11_03870 [Candidatus Harrisonbacteria bacterium CG10_big_fil_rev_8_21_14_0_10_49_15]
MNGRYKAPIFWGGLGATALLGVYFSALTLLSGFGYAQAQFSGAKYFILSLAAGFGIQVGLYVYLREMVRLGTGKVLGVTGTTSTVAMLSCCTHYLANLLPLIGAAGLVTLAAQYHIQLFWVGIALNLGGIAYIGRKIYIIRAL